MKRILLATTGLFAATSAHAANIQSGTIDGMPYQVLMPSTPCTTANPCSIVTYLGYMNSNYGDATRDLNNYFGGDFQTKAHAIVIAPTIPSNSQGEAINWGGYDTPTTPQQAQMAAVVKGVEAQLGNTVNPADNIVTGGSLGGTGTQAVLAAYGPHGMVEKDLFSGGASFDAAFWHLNASEIAALCGVPLLAVHGQYDTNQVIGFDETLGKAINDNPACHNSFTLMPVNSGHGSWSSPYGYRAGTGAGTPEGWLTSQLSQGNISRGGAGATSNPTPPTITAAGDPPSPTTTPPAPSTTPGATTASGDPPPITTTQPPTTTPSPAPTPTGTTPQAAQLAAGDGHSLVDQDGNVWTVSASGSVQENGNYVQGGGDTADLRIVNGTVWGLDNGQGPICPGCWFELNGDGTAWTVSMTPPPDGTVTQPTVAQNPPTTGQPPAGNLPTPPPLPSNVAPPPVAQPVAAGTGGNCAVAAPTGGGFHVANGRIVGPHGDFVARGFNIRSTELGQLDQALAAFDKGTNIVRINIRNLDSPQSLTGAVDYLTSRGIVALLEDHPDGGGAQDTWASQPGDVNWYKQAAAYYKDNPYVWFGSFNEPSPTNLGAWQQATYKAIRDTGNNNPILMEPSGSRPNNLDTALDPNVYANMTNVIADPHIYNYQCGYSEDQKTNNESVLAMIAATKRLRSADGEMPVIMGEIGDSTAGSSPDPGGMQSVEAVINAGAKDPNVGSIAWSWVCAGGDCLQHNGQLTNYGTMWKVWINTDPVPLTDCQSKEQANKNLIVAQKTADQQLTDAANQADKQPVGQPPASNTVASTIQQSQFSDTTTPALQQQEQDIARQLTVLNAELTQLEAQANAASAATHQ